MLYILMGHKKPNLQSQFKLFSLMSCCGKSELQLFQTVTNKQRKKTFYSLKPVRNPQCFPFQQESFKKNIYRILLHIQETGMKISLERKWADKVFRALVINKFKEAAFSSLVPSIHREDTLTIRFPPTHNTHTHVKLMQTAMSLSRKK